MKWRRREATCSPNDPASSSDWSRCRLWREEGKALSTSILSHASFFFLRDLSWKPRGDERSISMWPAEVLLLDLYIKQTITILYT